MNIILNQCGLNKTIVSRLCSNADAADFQLSQEEESYSLNYPRRMNTKISDYLEPYDNYHICDNKLYNIR